MNNTRYLKQTKSELRHISQSRKDITDKVESLTELIRKSANLIIGVHIRHEDYKTCRNGRYYYTLEVFHHIIELPYLTKNTWIISE